MRIKVNRITISRSVVWICIVLLFLSEMLFYLHIREAAFIGGTTKTILYGGIALAATLAWSRKTRIEEPAINWFLAFSLITIVSTAFGVTQDISFIRQAVHLLYFPSIFVLFYTAQRVLKDRTTISGMKYMYFIVLGMYSGAALNDRSLISGNAVYYTFMFMPVILMLKTSWIRYGLLGLETLLVLLSNKRTALVAVAACFLALEFFSKDKGITRRRTMKFIAYCFLAIVLYTALPLITERLNITVFREMNLSHIQEDGGSNRLYIFAQLWRAQVQGGLKHWLIGEGYNSVLLSHICTDGLLGGYVSGHNDLLEILYDYGLTGVILYFGFFSKMIKQGMAMVREKYYFATAFMMSIVLVFVISLTSHLIIYLNYYAVVFAFWGIVLADYRNWKEMPQGEC